MIKAFRRNFECVFAPSLRVDEYEETARSPQLLSPEQPHRVPWRSNSITPLILEYWLSGISQRAK